MKVIERNVKTGKVTERPYTQKELDGVVIMEAESAAQKIIKDKDDDIATKREAAIEEILLSGTSIKARAYQDAMK